MKIMSQLTKPQKERQNMLSLLEEINNQIRQVLETLNNSNTLSKGSLDEHETVLKSLQCELNSHGNKLETLGTRIDEVGEYIRAEESKHNIDDTIQWPIFDNISKQLAELLKKQNEFTPVPCNNDNQDIERLDEDVRNLANGVIALQQQLAVKDEQMSQLYEELQKFRSENTETTKLFTANHLIYIIDSLKNIIPLSECDDKSEFIKAFHSVVEISIGELATYFDIEPFIVEKGEIFNPKEQSAVRAEKTSNPDEVLRVKECQSQGYRIIDSNVIVKKASVIVWN